MSLENLNLKQKEAVTYVGGPLLIVAGAGTGKTTVITEKIFNLIENGLAKPEEILALTFTDKAAEEMAERVDLLLDKGYLDLRITTFHSFCQRILEQYGLDIGIGDRFKVLTPRDAWLLIRKNLHEFDLNYYKPLGNPTRHIHNLINHFSKCKDELIAPQDYLDYSENLVLNKDKVDGIEKSKWQELGNAYHTYNKILLDNAALDFSDLIFYTIKLLNERPHIREKLQNQFKFILVDEFQDVNWSQYYLVKLLCGEGSGLTVVGDDDQSIYAFRGASVSNILKFKEDFSKAKEIVLTENYRSGQKILDFAYEAIQKNNPDRLESKLQISKKLESKNNDFKGEVSHLHFDSLDRETEGVIQKIMEIKNQNSNVSWSDFAVLARANDHLESFINLFEKNGLPYEFLSNSGLFRQPIVLDSVNFLKLSDNYHESASVFRMLRIPFLNLNEEDLHKFAAYAEKKTTSYFKLLANPSFASLSEDGLAVCAKILELIKAGMISAKNKKPTEVLFEFLENSGYLEYLVSGEKVNNREILRSIGHLKDFLDFISVYEAKTPDANVKDFLEYFSNILESGDEGDMSSGKILDNAINVLTIHRSKGLEFKFVFVVNLTEDRFPSRNRGEPIEIPVELIKEQLPEGNEHIQEERRLFYVAVTRAKEKIFFTSATNYGGVRNKKISRFLVENNFSADTNQKQEEVQETLFKPKTKSLYINEEPSNNLTPKIFSYSQIKEYKSCPYRYKLNYITKIPKKGSGNLSFGVSIHNTLQEFYKRVQDMNELKQTSLFEGAEQSEKNVVVNVPSVENLLDIYQANWVDDWFFDKNQREAYFEKGKKILRTFYKQNEGIWGVPAMLEQPFLIKIDDFKVRGRIDRIDKIEDGIEIIDYKTSQILEKEVTIKSEDKEQLYIYQLAAETLPELTNLGKAQKLSFYFLDNQTKVSFIGNQKQLDSTQKKIAEIVKDIEAERFDATPSSFVCGFCPFKEICKYRKL